MVRIICVLFIYCTHVLIKDQAGLYNFIALQVTYMKYYMFFVSAVEPQQYEVMEPFTRKAKLNAFMKVDKD